MRGLISIMDDFTPHFVLLPRLIRCHCHCAARILAADVARCYGHRFQAIRLPCAYCKTWVAYAMMDVE
jgi:hypothetical protein